MSCGNHSVKFVHESSDPPRSTCLRPEILQQIWRYKRESPVAIRIQKSQVQVRGKRVDQNGSPVWGLTASHMGNRSWIWSKVPMARDAVPRRHWRVCTLPMRRVPCFHALITHLNVVRYPSALSRTYCTPWTLVTSRMNSMNWITKTWTVNVTISCSHPIMQKSDRLNVVQYLFFASSRVYVFVALLSAFSLNIVYGTDASPQVNASSATVLMPCISILESSDQKVFIFCTSKCSKLSKLSDCAVWWQLCVRRARRRACGIFGCQWWLLEAILKKLWIRHDFRRCSWTSHAVSARSLVCIHDPQPVGWRWSL